jgi:signal transduction histidine kinase/tetratricopeptide (TPR) repeat protein
MYQKISLIKSVALIACGLCFVCQVPFAQTKEQIIKRTDSLKNILSSLTGTEAYKVNFAIAYDLFDVDNPDAVKYADQAHKLSYLIKDSLEVAKSGRIFGQLLRRVGRTDEAIDVFLRVLPVAERNHYAEEEKKILNALAIAYNFKALYDKALFYSFRSLDISRSEGNEIEIGVALNNVGLVYYKLANYSEAFKYYHEAYTKLEGSDWQLSPLLNLALTSSYLGHYQDAKNYVDRSLALCGNNCDPQYRLQAEFCLGQAYFGLKDYSNAEKHLIYSVGLAEKMNEVVIRVESLTELAKLYSKMGDIEKTIEKLTEAEGISYGSGLNQVLINIYALFKEIYKRTSDLEKVAFYQDKYIKFKDSVYNHDLLKNLASVQTAYAERENIRTIAEKDEILALKERIIARDRQVYFFIAAVAVLAIVAAYALFRLNRQQHIANNELEARVIERTDAYRKVNEELDLFIYKTSHDIRGPLASLQGLADLGRMEAQDDKSRDYFTRFRSSIDKLDNMLKRLQVVNEINHAALNLEKFYLLSLVESLVAAQAARVPENMTIKLEIDATHELVGDSWVLGIALANLIDNAIKFTDTNGRTRPLVVIRAVHKRQGGRELTRVSVIDNGVKIEHVSGPQLFQMFVRASERSETGGVGLYIARLAIEKIYGNIDYQAGPANEKIFSVEFPSDLAPVVQVAEERRKREQRRAHYLPEVQPDTLQPGLSPSA